MQVAAVVKANAYGHGLRLIGAWAVAEGADCLAVATVSEGAALRRAGIEAPVLLLGPFTPDECRALVRARLTPLLWTLADAEQVAGAARAEGLRLPVHIKMDTGMGRWGVSPEEAPTLARAIGSLPPLHLEGIASHFATADEIESPFTREQLQKFLAICREVPPGLTRHIANSAALLAVPGAALDLVRVGLALYGVSPFGDEKPEELRPVLTWKSGIAAVKEVPGGASVGYGRHFTATRPSRIAVIPVGYGDGLPWGALGASMLVRGRRVPLVGRISMDSSFLDITGVPDVALGDEVVILGAQGKERITAWEWARWARTIPYAILTGISHRVARLPRRALNLAGQRHSE